MATVTSGPDVVLVGDSLIEYMQMYDFWGELFEPLNCVNMGVGGERWEQVLQRVEQGDTDNLSPKVLVVLCGTNNVTQTAWAVSVGVMRIVRRLRDKHPTAHIIVVGIPPKGPRPNKWRDWAVEINAQLEHEVAQCEACSFHQMDPALFVREDGTIDQSDMFDYLHFTSVGYMKWVPALQQRIKALLNK